MFLKTLARVSICLALILATSCSVENTEKTTEGPRWLAGDHHIHSRYSVGYDREADPPTPIIGQDAIYPIPMNVLMARYFGLSWTVATDHGGPNHSKVNFDIAYPEVQQSRAALPDVIQFYGMELNTPGADHSSLIIPKTNDERSQLQELEHSFDKYEAWPIDPERDQPEKMLAALKVMDSMSTPPVVIANHPSRSATGFREYGLDEPAELRGWNDTAPNIAVGMAGAPGHQAGPLSVRAVPRGAYGRFPTLGGFDQMTAHLGGFWDSMLGEGRHWWITANSDSHKHHSEGGIDFWPGEFSKTYVFAEKNHASILSALRGGKIFVTTGDLVSEVYLTVTGETSEASIGGTLRIGKPGDVTVQIKVRDPSGTNHHGDNPAVSRIDIIVGDVTGPVSDKTKDTNDSTRVLARFDAGNWKRSGEMITINQTISVAGPMYIRIRGTSTDQLEPEQDAANENPWNDLWFYSNPVFVDL